MILPWQELQESWQKACPTISLSGATGDSKLFLDEDYVAYSDLMAQWCRKYGVDIWASRRLSGR